MQNVIKIIIAALLLGCLLKVPYGYFQFIRIVSCIGFCWLAYAEFEKNKAGTGILSIGCAILLNPIIKIHFNRTIWNNIDIAIASGLILWVIVDLVYLSIKSQNDNNKYRSKGG